ncbi:hypothetical protein GS39_07060 [Escherichia coli]|nr:hypothetical protein GS39_07060 [Escherichia coli]
MIVINYFIFGIITKGGCLKTLQSPMFCRNTIARMNQRRMTISRQTGEVKHGGIENASQVSIFVFYFNSGCTRCKYAFIFSKITESLIWYFSADR